ncbi:MAG TPA: serine hydrolase domain-containing protein, partial [Burkholderiaceae bacterium]|nr:serine hydrolase domain-containing protein [Burkholderiaceae bacterium]
MTRSPTTPGVDARTPRRRQVLAALGATLLLGACALPGAQPAAPRGVSGAHLDAFMRRVEADSTAGRLPGAVLLVARDGRLQYARAVGVQDPASGRPMARDAIFRIYSMTKPIVSIAAMQLVEDGRLRIGDPVWRYVPEIRGMKVAVEKPGPDGRPAIVDRVASPREMTVQDLLRHTSGLTYQPFGRSAVKDEYAKVDMTPASRQLPFDLTEMARRLGTLPLAYVPGTTWDYSISTDLLGLVVERASGMKLDAYLQQRILGPLGMKDTAFWVPPDKQARLAEAYPVDPDSKAKVELLDVRRPPVLLAGGGGMVSTADDYLRFVQMLLNGGELDGTRIVSRKTVEYMASDHLGAIGRGPAYLPGPGHGFGLGFAVRTAAGESSWYGSVGDYYWGGYAGTAFWVDPKERLVAVWMMQGPGQSGQYRPLLRAAVYTAL